MRSRLIIFGILMLGILAVTMALLAGSTLGRFMGSDDIPIPFLGGGSESINTPIDSEANAELAYPGVEPTPEVALVRHTIQSGETLSMIALLYDVALDELMAANDISDPDLLFAGQVLIIPGVTGPATAVAGDTASVILEEYGAKPLNVAVNGLPESSFIVISPAAMTNARQIFAKGQSLGRDPRAFAKIGDSTIEIPFFLARFDTGAYELGDYAYLQGVIDQFGGSYARDSVVVRIGLHAWSIFDPTWADKAVCQAAETPIECEFRIQNPSVVLIRLGSNDAGAPELFDESMRDIVQYAIDVGVVPIIGTKADRSEGSNQNNEILRQIATDFQVPLWEFDLVAETAPGRGLDVDNVHMSSFYAHDYTLPEAFERGHGLHNLTALMMLDTIWKEVILRS